jgi:hypothetical protein
MIGRTVRAVSSVVLAAFTLMGALAPQHDLEAQRVGGTAYGTSVKTLLNTTQSPVASLPETGGYDVGDAETFGVPSAVDARWLTAVTTGSVGGPSERSASAQSVSEVESVSILNGLIRADNVTAVASSYVNSAAAASNADGSGFVNLVVNAIPIPAGSVAPNTRIDLPGIGYVILNEQTRTGDGVSTSGITVNMIHVYQVGGAEIVVGSASSSVRPYCPGAFKRRRAPGRRSRNTAPRTEAGPSASAALSPGGRASARSAAPSAPSASAPARMRA